MANFKIGDKVKIVDTNIKGRVISLDANGKPDFIQTDTEIIDVVDKVIKLLGFLKPILRLIISFFK